MSSSLVAYNPNDPLQAALLNGIAQGETGGAANSATEGYGGANLSGDPVNQYGFPQWSGVGNTQAAGTYQFEPSTWDSVASQYNLNFQNPQNQSEGAWYLAQQTYAAKNGGASLYQALQNGQTANVQSSLASIWPSVTGGASNPGGLATSLNTALTTDNATGNTSALNNTLINQGLDAVSGPVTASAGGGASPSAGTLASYFTRAGLIIVGGIVVLVALYFIMDTGAVKAVKNVLA